MDELNQVLERMQIAFAEKQQNASLLSNQKLGSTNDAGNLTIHQPQPAQSQVKQIEPEKQSSAESINTKNLCQDSDARQQLVEFLTQCYDGLNTFGKTPEQLENLTSLFLVVLGEYPLAKVRAAFIEHIRRNPTLPTPADIVNIIDPLPQQLSTAMYIKIMKDCTVGGKFLYGQDKAFVEAYEAQEMAKVRGGSDELREAKLEIENFRLAQLEYANG